MQAIKQYVQVENGYLHIKLPENFRGKNVEVIILTQEKQNAEILKNETTMHKNFMPTK